jgi:hypothetical protein
MSNPAAIPSPGADDNPFETLVRGEDLLDRAKSVAQSITERIRQIAPEDAQSDTSASSSE